MKRRPSPAVPRATCVTRPSRPPAALRSRPASWSRSDRGPVPALEHRRAAAGADRSRGPALDDVSEVAARGSRRAGRRARLPRAARRAQEHEPVQAAVQLPACRRRRRGRSTTPPRRTPAAGADAVGARPPSATGRTAAATATPRTSTPTRHDPVVAEPASRRHPSPCRLTAIDVAIGPVGEHEVLNGRQATSTCCPIEHAPGASVPRRERRRRARLFLVSRRRHRDRAATAAAPRRPGLPVPELEVGESQKLRLRARRRTTYRLKLLEKRASTSASSSARRPAAASAPRRGAPRRVAVARGH